MFEMSDAGRKESGLKEKSDCTVRAIAITCRVEYMEAHKKLAEFGRKNRSGFNLRKYCTQVVKELGCEARQVARSGSLAKLIKKFPNDVLLVRVSGHAFAVVDGVVKDTWEQKEGRHVKGAWIITKEKLF